MEQGRQTCRVIAQRIDEVLGCAPERLRETAGLNETGEMPDLEEAERKLDRALKERESMGPVNLRAEQEVQELETQIGGLTTEKDDLLNAISRLRQGIGELNREGRERLLASFEAVDRHFRSLFVRLFGGGRAHLALVESDDPLEAGLEIMASPPGKRLQILSLLSGGEQALTALAAAVRGIPHQPGADLRARRGWTRRSTTPTSTASAPCSKRSPNRRRRGSWW